MKTLSEEVVDTIEEYHHLGSVLLPEPVVQHWVTYIKELELENEKLKRGLMSIIDEAWAAQAPEE